MKDIKKQLQEYYKQMENLFSTKEDHSRILHPRKVLKSRQDEEFLTGAIVVFLIILILFSGLYYFIYFAPQEAELKNLKEEKINRVNTLLINDTQANKLAIISEIESKNTIEELENLDVDAMIYPLLKNSLLEQLDEYKDKYNRVEVCTDNTSNIMKINDARNYINSLSITDLSLTHLAVVDSVIIPVSINRKQAASGLIGEDDVVDIYKTTISDVGEENISQTSSKIVGGSTVVSILRSKDSGNLLLNSQDNNSESSTVNIEEILSSKAAGTYNTSKLLLEDYSTRLSYYERTSNIGELDVEYIILLEVPRESVEDILDNMDNIILTIPTYDAPSWVNL